VKQARHPRRARPVSRLPATVHQVGNVMVSEERTGEITVNSTLQLVEFRNEKQRLYGALVEHRLRRGGGEFQNRRSSEWTS
jgi:3-phenylpropionate/cinnamic acid dioxygenase small subunit